MKKVVKVITRAKECSVTEEKDGSLKVRLTAVPAEGKANEQLIAVLSKEYRVPKSRIMISRGRASHTKTVVIDDSTKSAF